MGQIKENKMNKIKLMTFAILPLLTNVAISQEQNNEKRPLPELTIEQKWQRSNWLVDVMMVTGINQAKSNGNTVKYWGEFIGELFAPGWEGVKTPWDMLRGMYRNYQLTPGFEMEMIKESNDAVTFRLIDLTKVDLVIMLKHMVLPLKNTKRGWKSFILILQII